MSAPEGTAPPDGGAAPAAAEHAVPPRPLLILTAFVLSAGWFGIGRVGRIEQNVGVYLGIYGAVMAVVVALLAGPALRPFLRVRTRDVVLGVAAGGALVGATYLAYPVLADLFPVIVPEVRALYAAAPVPPPVMPLIALTAVVEELIWRGFFAEALRHRTTWVAAVEATLVYAAAQVGAGGWLLFVVAFALGGLWMLERLWTRSLVAPILTHLIWTLTVIAAVPLEPPA